MRLRLGEDFTLDLGGHHLLRSGGVVPLQPKVFRLLVNLVENRQRVVTKQELFDTLWPDQAVVPDVLTSALRALRRALDDDATEPRFVRTAHGIGYQFVAPVVRDHAPDSPAVEARHAAFVARRTERATIEQILVGESDVQLVFVHGPPGIGKTSLLQEVAYTLRHHENEPIWLRGDEAGPFPDAFLRALGRALGLGETATLPTVRQRLAGAGRVVLLVDDFHQLAGVEAWLRQELWPALPREVRIVLAGRAPPSARWRGDPAFAARGRELALAPFEPDEVAEFVASRRLPSEGSERMRGVTRGLPLALDLWCDVLARTGTSVELFDQTNIIDTLVASFTDSIRDVAELRALEAACLFDEVTERALASLLDLPEGSHEVAERLRWLCSLSFATPVCDGVRVHALVREAVIAQLARRSPTRLGDAVARGHRFGLEELKRTDDPATMLRATHVFMSVGRHHPALRGYYHATDEGVCFAEPGTSAAFAELRAAIEQHEGPASTAIHERWMMHPRTLNWVIRDPDHRAAGLVLLLRLGGVADATTVEIADPVVDEIYRALADSGETREGDQILIARTLLDADTYQGLTRVMKECFIVLGFAHLWHHTQAPDVAGMVVVVAAGDLWEPVMASAQFRPLDGYDAELGGRRFRAYYLGFRHETIVEWCARLAAGLTPPP